jgi:multidrug efflux pump subunit AcrB
MKNSQSKLANFSLAFTNKFRATVLIWLVILSLGLFSYTTLLKREGFPPIAVPIGFISGTYFVDDAESVETDVVEPIQEAVLSQNFIVGLSSSANENSFRIIAEFEADTPAEDGIDKSRQLIERLELPENAVIQYTVIDAGKFDGQNDMLVALYTKDGADAEEIQSSAKQLADSLSHLEEVQSSEVQQIVKEVSDPISGESETRQTGFSKIGLPAGDEGLQFFNAVNIGIIGAEGIDTLTLADAVDQRIAAYNEEQSETQAIVAASFADGVRNQLDSLLSNVAVALLIVLVITAIMISWKAAIVSGIFIITVMAAILSSLYIIGYSLNTISLFALVLTLGLFVDDATIIVEALDANKNRRKRARDAVRLAIGRVGLASIAGTITTVLVFAPMLFVSGVLGDFIRILPMTVIISLLLSLILSLIIIPLLGLPLIVRSKSAQNPFTRYIERSENWLASLPHRLKEKGKHGKTVAVGMIAGSLLLVVGGIFLAGRVGFNVFPSADDADSLLISGTYTTNVTIEEAQGLVSELNTVINDVAGIDVEKVAYFGGSERGFDAQVTLKPFQSRDTAAPEYVEALKDRFFDFSSMNISVSQLDAGPPEQEYPFRVQVVSNNRDKSMQLAEDISQHLQDNNLGSSGGADLIVSDARIASPAALRQIDGEKIIEVEAKCEECSTTAFVQAAQASVENEFDSERLSNEYSLPDNTLQFDFGQESENISSFESTIVALFIAIALIYLVLVLQFNSFLQPLLILLAVPFSFIGVFGSLYITDTPISFFVMIGLIGLVGIVVNNAILLVDYANQERDAGNDTIDAITNAISLRFRALVTTTLTTFFALTPLALTDPFWKPLVYVIIFGLAASTFIIIFAFPYYYLISEKVRDWGHKHIYRSAK